METKDTLDFVYPGKNATIIKVIGVGGGGGNAVEHMYREGIHDVSFVLANTDNQALNKSSIPRKVQLGITTTQGLGAGNQPEVAEKAAQESYDELSQLLDDGTKMVFITAGMGGGTGTGAAPVVAKIAKEKQILTVGIVTIPFLFEGMIKINQALNGVEKMSRYVDALLVINNELLHSIYSDLDIPTAFRKADETLTIAAKSIAEIITIPGIMNLDFADVKNTLKDGGIAIMSTGIGSGEKRLTNAIENALHSPLLSNNNPFSAKKVLLNLYYSKEHPVKIAEMQQINEFMSKFDQRKIKVIWGHANDEALGEEVKVTLLATGFETSSIPGMTQKQEEDVKKVEELEEEEQRHIEERISIVYGKGNYKGGVRVPSKPIILNESQLDDDAFIELLEGNPCFSRDPLFVQKIIKQSVVESKSTEEEPISEVEVDVEEAKSSEEQQSPAEEGKILF